MYTPVEVLDQARQSVRRAVRLGCQVLADGWDEPVAYEVRDLSEGGLFLDAPVPMEEGTPLLVALRPEGWTQPTDLVARAVIRRVHMRRRRAEGPSAGMGLAFTDLPEEDVQDLQRCLLGRPPRLPGRPRPPRVEAVWVERCDDDTPS
jgi:hypothetical protein